MPRIAASRTQLTEPPTTSDFSLSRQYLDSTLLSQLALIEPLVSVSLHYGSNIENCSPFEK